MAQPISEGYFLPWSPLPFPTESFSRVPETPAILLFGGVLVWNANMLQIANNLIVGFHSDTERVSGRSVETAHNNDRARPF
jgi:hypothetical protein